jgi:hypothetical protein
MPEDRDLRIKQLRAEISDLRKDARRLTTLVWLPTTEPERKERAQAELEDVQAKLDRCAIELETMGVDL